MGANAIFLCLTRRSSVHPKYPWPVKPLKEKLNKWHLFLPLLHTHTPHSCLLHSVSAFCFRSCSLATISTNSGACLWASAEGRLSKIAGYPRCTPSFPSASYVGGRNGASRISMLKLAISYGGQAGTITFRWENATNNPIFHFPHAQADGLTNFPMCLWA